MPIGTQDALDSVIGEPFRRRLHESLRRLVTPELIASHNADPLGAPSDDLRRVLAYFGELPVDGKLIVEYDSERRWYVCRMAGSPPRRADRIAGPLNSQRDALVLIFMKRLVEVFDLDMNEHDV